MVLTLTYYQMSSTSSPVAALFFSFFLLLSAADAFNITKILSPYPDFTTFNNLLIQTGVATEINKKQTVTVLVVANANMSAVSGQSIDAMKNSLSVHVILDYYDEAKLQNLHAKALILTTLYQQSGKAQNQQGFVNLTHAGNGPVAFGSAAPGSNLDSTFVKQITSQPYNISVLQVTNIINVASNSNTPSSPPPPSPTPAVSPNTPAASPPRKALAPGPSHKESPAASPPNPSNAPAADDPGSGSDNKSSTVSVTSGNYLASTILMIFTWALVPAYHDLRG